MYSNVKNKVTMEEEEGDWDEGPTIEEIISTVVKRPSKFGDTKNIYIRGKSTSPENDQAPESKSLEGRSYMERGYRNEAKTSSSVFGVLNKTVNPDALDKHSPILQEKGDLQGPYKKSLSLSCQKMPRSVSAPAMRSQVLTTPSGRIETEVYKPVAKQLGSHSTNQGSHNYKPFSLNKENVRSNTFSNEKLVEMSRDTLKPNSTSCSHDDALLKAPADCTSVPGKGEANPKSSLTSQDQNTLHSSVLASAKTYYSGKFLRNFTSAQDPKTYFDGQKRELTTESVLSFAESRPAKMPNTACTPLKTDHSSKLSPSLNSQPQETLHQPTKVGFQSPTPQEENPKHCSSVTGCKQSFLRTAHHSSEIGSQSHTPTEENLKNHSSSVTGFRLIVPEMAQMSSVSSQNRISEQENPHSKSSTITGTRITVPGTAQLRAAVSHVGQGEAVSSKATSYSAAEESSVHTNPISADVGYVSANSSRNLHPSSHSQNGMQIFHTPSGSESTLNNQHHPSITSNQHQTPMPSNQHQTSTPSASQLLNKMDNIIVNGQEYFKLGLLGRGGSSKVYEVLDLNSRKMKAIKVVELEGLDKATLDSYKNEVEKLQRLQSSDRVIRLYDFEYTGSHLLLVMEKGNQDFASLLKVTRGCRSAPISPFTIKHYWEGMLQAVQAIHNAGIIHSDLKPANFVLVNQTVKLIDFGIASSIQQDMTSVLKDSQAGTFNYMSPESLMDVKTGPVVNNPSAVDKVTIKIGVKSDVWSLGCILYNLVYGKTPFQDITNPLRKLSAISNPATEIHYPEIEDKQLLNVMKQCLQFEPRKRPSIQQLLQHPYLTEGAKHSEETPEKMPHLKSAINQLAQLTPNSLHKITSMLQQMKPNSSFLSTKP